MNASVKIDTGRMTSKGQVLIPRAVREAIGLAPNAFYKVVVNHENKAVISPISHGSEDAEVRVQRMRAGIEKLSGTGKTRLSTDEIMRELRGDWEP